MTSRGKRKKRGEQRCFYETRFPASDEHLMKLANKAVSKARIPASIMSYDECLSSAYLGIMKGWEKYDANAWQSSLEWLLMQGYYQILSDAKKTTRNLSREIPREDFDYEEDSERPSPLEQLEEEEREDAINALLSVLSKRDRIIVRRIAIYGESAQKVSRRLKLKRSEVKKRYAEAIERLKLIIVAAAESVEDSD